MMTKGKKGAILANSIYCDGKIIADDAEITLPDLEFLTAEIQAAGPVEIPLWGLLNAIELGITVPGISKDCAKLAQPEPHNIVINAVQQKVAMDGTVDVEQIKVSATGTGKKAPSGAPKTGEVASQEYIISCSAYKLDVDGDEVYNVNKFTGDCFIAGKNYGKKVKSLL